MEKQEILKKINDIILECTNKICFLSLYFEKAADGDDLMMPAHLGGKSFAEEVAGRLLDLSDLAEKLAESEGGAS